MTPNPFISSITIFPIKSLDGIQLEKVQTTPGGSLLHDREFAIADDDGNFLIGKTAPTIHLIRTIYNLENYTASFWIEGNQENAKQFHLIDQISEINNWLSEFFGKSVQLIRNTDGRFLDIPDISGITFLSRSSLDEIAKWYPEMSVEETKRRFRSNIVIGGVEAFWEDHLFAEEGTYVLFKVGDVELLGISPRARCVVPTRNPVTSVVSKNFAKTFGQNRAKHLPEFSKLDEYGHYYFLTVNVLIPPEQRNKTIRVGDEIELIRTFNEDEAQEYLES